jgi:hypothetical protein
MHLRQPNSRQLLIAQAPRASSCPCPI